MEVYIIGCGGNSKVVVDICDLRGYRIMGFFDDRYRGVPIVVYGDHRVIGTIADMTNFPGINVINSIGDNRVRKRICESGVTVRWINCVHPQAHISPTARMGEGNVVCHGAVINSDAVVGSFNLVNTYSIVEHDCRVGDFNHLAPRTTLCGGITVGDLNLVGAGATILPGKRLGHGNVIGAMSVVLDDIVDGCVVVGIPGRVKKSSL